MIRRLYAMEIKRIGTQPSGQGPAERFTGTVRIAPCSSQTRRHRRARRQTDYKTVKIASSIRYSHAAVMLQPDRERAPAT
jgi:hypothetical protein